MRPFSNGAVASELFPHDEELKPTHPLSTPASLLMFLRVRGGGR